MLSIQKFQAEVCCKNNVLDIFRKKLKSFGRKGLGEELQGLV